MKYLDYVLLILVLCFHCDALSPCEQEVTIELGLEAKSVYHYKDPTYERFLLCEWRFLANNPNKQIVYQFTNISVDCGDTLTAFTNETEYTAPSICGIGKDSETAVTPAGELKLVLNSDKNIHEHEKGFTLHMIAAKGNEICPQQAINVTSVKQQIASPRFPNLYVANLQCRFILTAPSGVELTFEYIDVEKHKDCPPSSCCDEIIIYEGLASENKKLASICGSDMFHPNLTYESLGRTLTLELRTDNQGPRKGFVATVQAKKGDPIPIIPPSVITTTEKPLTPPVLVTTEAVIYTPKTTESSIETLEAWTYGTFELRCVIPTLERGVGISWTLNGYPFLPAHDSNRYYFMEDNTLVKFTSIYKEDAGIYKCEANEPFYPTYTARVVVRDKDVNECEQNVCPVNSVCINTIESYRCECHEGWEGQQCDIDINECEIRSSLCLPNGKCLNLDGNYTCNCNQGWTGDNCHTDINECEAQPHPCYPNGKCVNSEGDFTCECNNGWTGDNCLTDLNECQVQPRLCAPNGNCVNQNGSYDCECKPGWTGDNCQKESSIETLEAWTYGTFELRCVIPTLERGVDISWTLNGYPFVPAPDSNRYYFMEDNTLVKFTSIYKEDAGIYKCEANEPFYPTYTARVVVRDKDVNECEQNVCPVNSVCINTIESYRCECHEGWEGQQCDIDINECEIRSSLCLPNGKCLNLDGNYTCNCNQGWTGENCHTDINECEILPNPCSGHGSCVNSRGDFFCSCYNGWEGKRCDKSINKCELQPKLCAPNGKCLNVNVSHICKCNIGWTGDDCLTDVNECKIRTKDSMCGPNGRCVNIDGGYFCECNEGWAGRKCQSDVNECNALPRPCSGHGNCVNSVGSYFCSCYKDWEGITCEKRIDPCLADPCPKNAICKMKGNSFKCVCKTGWEGPQCEKEVQKASGPCAAKCQGTESCYMEHNCTHYEHCYAWNGAVCHCTLMICSFGTFWNSKINNCDMVAQVNCKSDPCLHLKYGSTYTSYFNCRTFYTCNKHQHSLPMCCNKGYSYNHQAQKCTPNPYCNVECAKRETTQTTVSPVTTSMSMETCYFRPVAKRPTKYLNLISNIIQDCPLGTIFEEDYCVCVQDLSFSRGKCVPIVHVDFNGDHIINLSHESYLQINNVQQVESGIPDVTYGLFNGQSSSIQIPRLNAVALPRLKIQLRFYASMPSNSRYQVLVSNCRSSAKPWNILDVAQDQSPSLAIIANTLDQHLTFLGYSDDWKVTPVTFHLPYKAGAWNNVELAFNGSSLKGRVRSVNKDQSAFETYEEMPFSGRIAAPTGPLIIGRCSDKDAFYGYIDMVKVYDCVTSL